MSVSIYSNGMGNNTTKSKAIVARIVCLIQNHIQIVMSLTSQHNQSKYITDTLLADFLTQQDYC